MLSLTRRILALRRSEPALSRGAWTPMTVEGEVVAYLRGDGGKRFAVVLNLEGKRKTVRFAEANSGRIVLSTHDIARTGAVGRDLVLAANEGVVIAI